MRVARSTVRANLRPPIYDSPSPEEFERQRVRQLTLNLISGSGCGTCSGFSPIFGKETGGSEMRCPLLEPERLKLLSEDQAKLAAGCGIPELYRQVEQGDTAPEEVTEGLVFLTCPFLEVDNEAEPDGDPK